MTGAGMETKFRYLIARLVDVVDTKLGKVVSSGHKNHDEAEKAATKLLLEERT